MSYREFKHTTSRVDFAAWVKANVNDGDTVHLKEGATYWTEGVRLVNPPKFILKAHGATFLTRVPPIPAAPGREWRRGFELVNANGVQVYDLKVKGPRLPGSGYNEYFAGQHAFSFIDCSSIILCRNTSAGHWGDHIYISDRMVEERYTPTNIIICEHDASTESGRQGVSVVAGDGILIAGSKINALRTAFNLEVHPEQVVRNYEVSDCDVNWRLRTITGTGSGEASDITFKNLRLKKSLNAEVYGIGYPGRSGVRRNWRIEGFTGPSEATPAVSEFQYVDGLTVVDVPYPLSTDGSTLTAVT
jgi:hypothetical protein